MLRLEDDNRRRPKRTRGICLECQREAELEGRSAFLVDLVNQDPNECNRHYQRRKLREDSIIRIGQQKDLHIRRRLWGEIDQRLHKCLTLGFFTALQYRHMRNTIDDALWLEDEGGAPGRPVEDNLIAVIRKPTGTAIIFERRKVCYVSIGDKTEPFESVEHAKQYVFDVLGLDENTGPHNH